MLGVDKRCHAARFLRLGDTVQGHGGLAAAFRTVDLHHAAARQTSHAQRHVQIQAPGGDDLQVGIGNLVAEFHHAALAVGFVQLGQRIFQRLHLLLAQLVLFHNFLLTVSFLAIFP